MNIAQARFAGLKAFEAGLQRAPALNNDFTKRACSQKEIKVSDLLEAYLYGWDIANLASTAIDGAPSLKSYAEIVSNATAFNEIEKDNK